MFKFIKKFFQRQPRNVFDNINEVKQKKIMPTPQIKKVKALGDSGHLIEGNVLSILAENLLDLRSVCEDIVSYRENRQKEAMDEAIQQLSHMLQRPEAYTGYTEHTYE